MKALSSALDRKPVALFYFVLSAWLTVYTLKRFNGYDLGIIWDAGLAVLHGQSPYHFDQQSPYKYSPSFALFLACFQWIPRPFLPMVICLANLALLLRVTYVTYLLFEREFGFTSLGQKLLLIYLPWLLVFQGIGAQFEGGQTTIFLMFLGMEGIYQHVRGRPWGIALSSLVVFIKPQFLVLPILTANYDFRSRWRDYLTAIAAVGVGTLIPFVLGWNPGIQLYVDWLTLLARSTPDVLTNRVGNGNLGLYSFFYHLWHWPTWTIDILVAAAVFSLAYLVRKTRSIVLACAGAYWIAYLLSPISFAYSQTVMMIPGILAIGCCFDKNFRPAILFRLLALVLFLVACWLLQYDTVGKSVYETVVLYRLNAWFSVTLLVCLVPSSPVSALR
jgi:hypothetical protein